MAWRSSEPAFLAGRRPSWRSQALELAGGIKDGVKSVHRVPGLRKVGGEEFLGVFRVGRGCLGVFGGVLGVGGPWGPSGWMGDHQMASYTEHGHRLRRGRR